MPARTDRSARSHSGTQGDPTLRGAHAVPTYDYQCRSCGVITEVVHSMLEDGPTTCERCGGELRRVIHPTGIIFKGGGFYKTDSRSSSSSSVAGGTRSTKPSGDASAAPGQPEGGTAAKAPDASAGGADAPKGSGSPAAD